MTQLMMHLVGLIQEIVELSHNRDDIEKLQIAKAVMSCDSDELLGFKMAHEQLQQHREQKLLDERLATPIEGLGFSVRTYNCLKRANVDTLGELAGKTEEQLFSIRHFGRRSLVEVTDKLEKHDLRLQPNPVLLGELFGEELRKAYPEGEY